MTGGVRSNDTQQPGRKAHKLCLICFAIQSRLLTTQDCGLIKKPLAAALPA